MNRRSRLGWKGYHPDCPNCGATTENQANPMYAECPYCHWWGWKPRLDAEDRDR